MSLLGILTILLFVACLVGFFVRIILKTRFFWIVLGATLVFVFAFVILCTLWGADMYKGGDVNLARTTFLIGALFFASVIVGPFLKPYRILAWINMTAFLGLGIAFIILAVSLSKTEIQGAQALALILS